MKNLIKKILSTRHILKLSKDNRFIFVFHDVSDQDSPQYSKHYSTPIKTFKAQVNFLNTLFEIIPLEEIVTNKNLDIKKNYAAITFDDGFKSVLQNADPILTKLNIPYTVFLNSSALESNQIWVSNIEIFKKDDTYITKLLQLSHTSLGEGEDPITAIVNRGKFSTEFRSNYRKANADIKIYMDKEDIALLLKKNVGIENHSYDHFVLSSTLPEELKRQIKDNHLLIHSITGKNSKHFAIPFGKKEHFNKTTISELRSEGYNFIYTTNPNRFQTEDLSDEHFLFPRIGVTSETPEQLQFYINRAIIKTYQL
jgi:peptidoglycan/xylan/chitin deacetylase (PgdA/CDA1 family)